jgi:hypothetical protein
MTWRSETSETSEGTPTSTDLVSHRSLVSHVHHDLSAVLLELRLARHLLAALLDRLAERDRKGTR